MNNKLRIGMFGLLGLMVSLTSSALAGPPPMSVNTRMRVARHTNVAFINASVHDANFINATTALGVDSGANDVPCSLSLQRLDSYTFSGGGSSDIVNTQAEYEDTRDNAANSYTTIVNTLNWCDVVGSWGGCGFPTGGARAYLVTRTLATSAQGGIVYAHEFGHTTGLNHDNTGQQIMDPDVLTTADNRVRTANVCDFFFRRAYASTCPTGTFAPGQYAICSPTLGPPSFAAPIFSAVPSELLISGDDESDFSSVPIEELARSIIVDRIPHEAEFFYSQEDVELLTAMLGGVPSLFGSSGGAVGVERPLREAEREVSRSRDGRELSLATWHAARIATHS